MKESDFSLDGLTFLVTGASSGIGRQSCIQIAELGGRIVASGRDASRLRETLGMLSGRGHTMLCEDLTADHAIARLLAQLPLLDGVVHAAGILKVIPVKIIKESDVQELFDINYKAPMLLTQALLKNKKVIRGGSIVFVASIAGAFGSLGHGIYAGSKAALVASTRALAGELSGLRIRVNCISPGMVRTPMIAAGGSLAEEDRAGDERKYPLGYGDPVQVANPIAFLLSKASSWITGTNLIVDGGRTSQI